MSTIEQALAKKLATINDSADSSNEPEVEAQSITEPETKATTIEAASQQVELKAKTDNYIEINLKNLAEKDFIVPEKVAGNRILKEEFRQIKRKLLNNAFGAVAKTLDHPNLIMITSARPNEGKTYISINLALSIALEQDKTVLLVDADVLKPSMLKEFGVKSQPGLIEYLLGDKTNISDIIYHTNIDNLKVIPAGIPHHLSNELLASEKMATLAGELSSRYPDRVVIFDTPPLLGVTETPVLARLMGQALIAVEENKTSLIDVNQANSLLHDDLAKGLVLNKAIHSQKEIYGYYGYGYGKQSKD